MLETDCVPLPVMRARPLRGALAVVAAAACLSLTACGGGALAAAVAAPKAGAGKQSGLGVTRFRAIDAVYVAGLPGDKLRGKKGVKPAELVAAAGPVLSACRALDRNDALLRALRRPCPLAAKFIGQLADLGPACQDQTACVSAIRRLRRTLSRLTTLQRSSDRGVDAANITPACKEALRSPPADYPVLSGFNSALGLLQRGIATSSPTDVDEGQRRLKATQKLAEALPSAHQTLAKFRRACA